MKPGKLLILMLTLGLLHNPASALVLEGQVRDEAGQPIAGVMIKVVSSSAGAEATKVFTGADGRYRLPDLSSNVHINSLKISTFRLGYDQTSPGTDVLTQLAPDANAEVVQVDFDMQSTRNVAHQVPASAWLAKSPAGTERNRTLLACSQCHQMPNARVQDFAASLDGLNEKQREQSWRAITSYMRIAFYGALQAEHGPGLEDMPVEQIMKPEHSFLDQGDEDALAPFLAKYMPTNFDQFDIDDVDQFSSGRLGVNERTVIREFPWPVGTSFLRETAVMDGQVWAVDIQRNRLARLQPDNGSYRWYDLPRMGVTAPHTLVPDNEGNLWVTLLGGTGESAAKFNPRSEEWTFFGGFPKGVVAHDFSAGANYKMAFDHRNFNWMTIINKNSLLGFNPDSGAVEHYPLPTPKGEDPNNPDHTAVYGGGMTSDGNVWFAQYQGNFGRFNTKTMKVDHLVEFPQRQGPHRFQIDDNDMIYVSLLGSGEIMVYDGIKLQEVKRIALPDRNAAPYSVAWDPIRKVLWAGVTNNNTLFKIDPKTGESWDYPIEIKDLHIRMIAFDESNGDLWVTSSPLPPESAATNRIFQLHPGDI
ncbi:MAG: carboxypeptidase regulatory-like domain-containing protein [Gammaproteobacteria bacterium]|nr:carboxypeptidase regulatory-like domain-containing protein [Gammaproteobacteria bacterium]